MTNGVGTLRYRLDDSAFADGVPVLTKYRVVRKTPAGAWVMRTGSYARLVMPLEERSPKELREEWGARFVLDGNGRRFAHETEEWARQSYRIRKVRQVQHAKSAIERAEAALVWLETGAMPAADTFAFSFTSQSPEY